MKHSIKLDDHVYQDLERVREKRETFSEAVERLLNIRYQMGLLSTIVEGSQKFRDWEAEQKAKVNTK